MTLSISGTGIGRFGRRKEGLEELLEEAAREALERAPPASRRPGLLLVGSMAPAVLGGLENLVPRMADRLGLTGVDGYHVDTASASGAGVFHIACELVSGGRYESALVLAGEKMTGAPTEAVTGALARSLSPHEIRHGATMPALAALVAQEYLTRHRIPWEELGEVSVQNRENAVKNPNAQFRTPVTLEEVNRSRVIARPLRLLHVSAISDGAAGILLEHRPGPVRVRGWGQGTDVLEVASRPDPARFEATRTAARRAYEMARSSPREVDVAELHDAFAPFQLVDLEDVGFCGPGEALTWMRNGNGAPGGSLPINPSGGLLGRGHPVGASGLAQIVEVARQLSQEAGPLQAGHPRMGLTQSVGGLGSHNFVTLLGREEGP